MKNFCLQKITLILILACITFKIHAQCNTDNLNFINTKEKDGNCSLLVRLQHVELATSLYMNNNNNFYDFDSLDIADGFDTLCINLDEPNGVTLFINNDAENLFQFYLDEGNYILDIDFKNKTASVTGSPLNDEFKEMMRVHDSLYKYYNIMHYMLYPYNKTDRDTARAWLQKYGPICDSLSDIHTNNFYKTHPKSFLTLEKIFNDLQYIFEDPGFDTTLYDIKKLKAQFDKLDPSLKRYKMYAECIELFNKERVKPPEIAKPLWNGK